MITVIDAGSLSTVQDLGRQAYGHLGVPQAGAADSTSLRVANRLLGNADEAAVLEMTTRGAVLRFETGTAVALAGARTEATLDGEPVPMYQSVLVRAGATLRIGRISEGWRTYLAVAGDRKSTRLNSSHPSISYAVFCLKKKTKKQQQH